MSNYSNEQLMDSYKKLPKDVQDAITSVDTADILRQIGNEKNMMIDKVGELADETGLVLLGFTHPSQFISHLTERLGIEKSVAKEIAEEVNTRIFFPIRENLKKIHGLREEEVEEAEAPTFAESEVKVPAESSKPGFGESLKPGFEPEIEKVPTAPMSSPLPSALMPEPVILETTMPKITTPPPIPETPIASIFEAKTKEGVLRLPAEVSENPPLANAAESKKIDPYREQTI